MLDSHILDNVNCQSIVTCGSAVSVRAPKPSKLHHLTVHSAGGNQGESNSPAGMVIYNSFVGLHTIYEDTFAAFDDALVPVRCTDRLNGHLFLH